jgi:hypothetical protein
VIFDKEEAMSRTKGFLLGRASINSICALVSGAFWGSECAGSGVLARKKGAMTLSAKRPRPASGDEDREKGRLSPLLSWGGRWAARANREEVDVAGRMKKASVVEAKSAAASSRVATQNVSLGIVRIRPVALWWRMCEWMAVNACDDGV